MPENCLDPRDFVVTDPFNRTLRFYERDGKFWRRDESIYGMLIDESQPREVTKIVYAIQWLEACLAEAT